MSRNLRNRLSGGNGRGGRKNIKKTDTGYLLQGGFEITHEERKELESLVRKANYKRKKMLAEESKLPRLVDGKETGDTVGSLHLMGKESDFILTHKTASLQRFTSRESFENYLDNLKRVNDPNYIDERMRAYKRNYMEALDNAFGDDAKDVKMKVRMMKPEDYRKLVVSSDEDLEISYIYSPEESAGKLNRIRAALGMKLKED